MTAFYVIPAPHEASSPERTAWRMRHADATVNIAGAFFKAPHGEPVPEPDGTYEVRLLAPSNKAVVREMLTEHEGLTIVREEPLSDTIADFLTTEEAGP